MAQIENPYCYIVTKLQCDKKFEKTLIISENLCNFAS